MAVTNLSGTEWVFNDSLTITSNQIWYVNGGLTIQPGDHLIDEIRLIYDSEGSVYTELSYGVMSDAWDSNNGWGNDDFKSIFITDGTDVQNPDLIVWLTNNATLTAPQPQPSNKISVGSLPLSKMFVGNTEVTKAILNGVTLYEKTSPLPAPKTNLNSYTWAEVKQLADALAAGTINEATLSSTYNIAIGDTKSSSINNETHNYRLIGINHDVDANNSTLGFTFEQVDLMVNTYAMKSSMSSTDSWQNSDLKSTLEGFAVASDLAAVITPAKKVCANNVSTGTPTYNYINSTNGLWIESETEVAGTQNYTIDGTAEGSEYAYYVNSGSRIKQKSGSNYYWWLRSPFSWFGGFEESYFAFVNHDGGVDNSFLAVGGGVAPCFCI